MDTSLAIGIDYLTLILPVETMEDCLTLIDSISLIFSESYEFYRDNGRFIGRQFAHWAKSPNGGLIVWNLPGENGESLTTGSMRIALGGKVLCRATAAEIIRLVSSVFSSGGKCTRIDLKCDDFTRSMHPNLLEAACNAGNSTGFRKSSKHMDMSTKDYYSAGWTLYFGSRTSDRFTRYYNAFPVHKIEAWRYETEYKNGIANEIATMLTYAADDEMLLLLIAANIAGNISFVDRSGTGSDKNVDRCPMLDFWKDFTDRLGSLVRLSIPVVVPTIERSIEWLETRVAATLATISKYYGFDQLQLFKRLKKIGEERMGSRHYNLLETSRREPYKIITMPDDSFIVDYQYNG